VLVKVLVLSDCLLNLRFDNEKVDLNYYYVNNIEMNNCKGCFNCWRASKSQGRCINSDISEQIREELIESDVVYIVSNVRYGGYSYPIKKVLDRMIPLIPPLFEIAQGKIRKLDIFNSYPRFEVIGVSDRLTREQEQIFRLLIEKNAYTFHSPSYSVDFTNNEKVNEKLQILLDEYNHQVGGDYED